MARRRGKRIDVWAWRDRETGVHVKVEVRLEYDHEHARQRFVAVCDEPALCMSSEDINALRHDVKTAVQKQLARKWEQFIAVTVDGRDSSLRESSPHVPRFPTDSDEEYARRVAVREEEEANAWGGRPSAQVSLGVELVQVSLDGTVWREWEGHRWGAVREVAKYGLPWSRTARRTRVPDTPEARAALDRLFDAMAQLRARLGQFVSTGQAFAEGGPPLLGAAKEG